MGFGTGLNFLATLEAFRRSGTSGRLRFTSFEAFPMAPADLRTALAPYTDLPTDILKVPSLEELNGPDFELRVIIGDARKTLPNLTDEADAWFLDGFSPAKNPELWEVSLMNTVGIKTKPSGTFATYTAAGHVRRALAEAGFEVQRVPGFGRKRHMTVGQMLNAE